MNALMEYPICEPNEPKAAFSKGKRIHSISFEINNILLVYFRGLKLFKKLILSEIESILFPCLIYK